MLKFFENLYEVRVLRKNTCYIKGQTMYFKWPFPTAQKDFNPTYAEKINQNILAEILQETKAYKTLLQTPLEGLDKIYPDILEYKKENIVFGLTQKKTFLVQNTLQIKEAKQRKDLILWADIASKIYKEYDTDFIYASFKTDIKKNYASYFIFYKDKSPVGVSQVIRSQNYSGIYWVGILPEHRQSGLGTEITKQTLNYEIKNKRYRFVLTSSELGLHIYHKLGFKPLEKFYEYDFKNV